MLLWRQSRQPEYSVLIREMDLTFQFNFRRILSYQFKIQPIIFQRSRKILQISDLCSKSKIRRSNFQLTVTTPLRFYEENLENYSCLFSRACIFVFSRELTKAAKDLRNKTRLEFYTLKHVKA